MLPFTNHSGRTRVVEVVQGGNVIWTAIVGNGDWIHPPHAIAHLVRTGGCLVLWKDAGEEATAPRPTAIWLEDGPFDGEVRDIQEDPICPTLVIPFIGLAGGVEQVHYRFWAQLDDPPVLLYRYARA